MIRNITCYRKGGCGPYEMRSCNECPASKPSYLQKNKEEEKMKTKFNIGEEIDLKIKGIIRRIEIDKNGICYTISVKDTYGNESDLYIDDNVLEIVNQN